MQRPSQHVRAQKPRVLLTESSEFHASWILHLLEARVDVDRLSGESAEEVVQAAVLAYQQGVPYAGFVLDLDYRATADVLRWLAAHPLYGGVPTVLTSWRVWAPDAVISKRAALTTFSRAIAQQLLPGYGQTAPE